MHRENRGLGTRLGRRLGLPDEDDREIEEVPPVAEIRALVGHEPAGDDLHDALDREDHKEHVFRLLLQRRDQNRTTVKSRRFSSRRCDKIPSFSECERRSRFLQ